MNCVCGRQDKPHLILDGRVVKRLVPMNGLLMFPGAGVDGCLLILVFPANDLEFGLSLLRTYRMSQYSNLINKSLPSQ